MLKLSIILGILIAVAAAGEAGIYCDDHSKFKKWAFDHKKTYTNEQVFETRFAVFRVRISINHENVSNLRIDNLESIRFLFSIFVL